MTLIRLPLPIVDQLTCASLSIRPVHFKVVGGGGGGVVRGGGAGLVD